MASAAPLEVDPDPARYACPHYKRKCKFVTPCCDSLYRCRFCHDDEQKHTLKRDDVRIVECSSCGERQDVTEKCRKCNIQFGKYFCYECKLYDDEDKQQFHCSGCGICRVGGRSNYFHCHRCDMCLPNHLQGAHKCVEKVSRSNCPVCQEDIHTSRIPSQIPPCNHLIHKTCFDEMLAAGHYACPLCGISMIPMSEIWRMYDREIAESPMPEEYANLYAGIQCRDCLKASCAPFHLMGMKCQECGSYNTVREKGPLVRKERTGAAAAASVVALAAADDDEDEDDEEDEEEDEEEEEEEAGPEVMDLTAGLSVLTPPETPTRPDQMGATTAGIEAAGSTQLLPILRRRGGGIDRPPIRRLSFNEEAVTAEESTEPMDC